MSPGARLAEAIALLEAIEAAPHAPADAVASAWLRARRFIGSGDRRWISDLVWNVLRQRLRLDWHLADAPTNGRTRAIAWLLLGEQAPADSLAGLFGGARHAPPPLDPAERQLLQRLARATLVDPRMDEATRLNLPPFVLAGFRARFGDTLAAEAAAMGVPAPLDLRVNLLKIGRDGAQAALAAEGHAATPTPLSPWGLRLPGRVPVMGTKAFRAGLVEIQDEASQLAAWLSDVRPGMQALDFCAGAGGKTLALAAMMENTGRLVASDISAPRLQAASLRLRRAGVHNAECRLIAPGERWLKRAAGTFDRVLVDAPCTGSGTWRRNPAERLRLSAASCDTLMIKQREILAAAARLVKSGGRLIYATCSVLPEENEAQVDAFLAAHDDFAMMPLAAIRPTLAAVCPGPYLALSPAAHGTDGFFAAVLQRMGGP